MSCIETYHGSVLGRERPMYSCGPTHKQVITYVTGFTWDVRGNVAFQTGVLADALPHSLTGLRFCSTFVRGCFDFSCVSIVLCYDAANV